MSFERKNRASLEWKCRAFLLAVLVTVAFPLRADDSGDKKTVVDSIKRATIGSQSIGVDFAPSWIIPTNSYLRANGNGHRDNSAAFSPRLRYSFTFGRDSRLGALYPTAYQGVGLAYTAVFPNATLGHPVSFYVFQGARIASLGRRLSLDYEWNFGVSAGWRKYKSDVDGAYVGPDERPNSPMGSKVNAMINLGVVVNYKLTDRLTLRGGIEGTHYSNGNTQLPNPGANLFGAIVGLSYKFDERQAEAAPVRLSFEHYLGYDLTAYGAWRQRSIMSSDQAGEIPVRGHFGVCGLNFAPMYAFNRYLRAGVSADFQYDESANIERHRVESTPDDHPMFYRPSFRERFSAGLSLRAELTMPIFSINVGIGRNVISKGADTSIFYQTLALKAYVVGNAYLQIGYQLRDFHLPNNLMLGVGYSFGRHL